MDKATTILALEHEIHGLDQELYNARIAHSRLIVHIEQMEKDRAELSERLSKLRWNPSTNP